MILASPWAIRRWIVGRVRPRSAAFFYFSSIMAAGVATGVVLALIVFKFLSSSLLTAMGEACSGIFTASQGFLAESNWNYLLVAAAAAVFFSQLAFLLGGGSRLLGITRRFKRNHLNASFSCPALPSMSQKRWARHAFLLAEDSLDAQTVGVLRPRIIVYQGLVGALTSDELNAVLAHEEAHRSGRDNLLVAVAKVVSLTLFYLPTSKMAFREMCRNLELAADKKAAMAAGGPLQVASALAKIVTLSRQPAESVQMAPAVSGTGLGDISSRLQELLNDQSHSRRRWHLPLVFSGLSAAILLIFASSAFAVTQTDQRGAIVCFTEHTQGTPAGGICQLDHPDH